jgi:hypothetical protein
MPSARYTALLIYKQKVLFEKSDSSFDEVQASLLARLQDKFDNAKGLIIDNKSGRTVNSYRKKTSYD